MDIMDENIDEVYSSKKSKYKEFMQSKEQVVKREEVSATFCKKCGVDNPYENGKSGIMVCSICGECVLEIVDTSNVYVSDTAPNNYVSINKYFPELSSVISLKGLSKSSIVYKLHNWYSISYGERALNEKYKLIQSICLKYGLLKCVEDTTKILYTQIYYEKLGDEKNPIFRGNKYLGLIANCLWYAGMKYGINLYPKELAQMCGIPISYVKKGEEIFNGLCRLKNFKIDNVETTPEDYIIRFCQKLNIHKIYCDKALCVSKNSKKIKIFNGQQPITIALGIIYSTCVIFKLNISKNVIAEMFDTVPSSIIKTFKKFEPFLNILLNDEMCNIIENKINAYQLNIYSDEIFAYNAIKYNCFINFENIKLKNNSDIIRFQKNVSVILNSKFINIKKTIQANEKYLNLLYEFNN